MLHRTLLTFSTQVNHLGQTLPLAINLALTRVANENAYKSNVWVTPAILEQYAQTVSDEKVKPTVVKAGHRPICYYNADQVQFYMPRGIGHSYSGPTAQEMVLAAKLHGFKSSFWSATTQITQKGLLIVPGQHPVMISGRSYYNADQIQEGEEHFAAAEKRVKSLPEYPFRSISGKTYNRELRADLAEFCQNNKINQPGMVWATSKSFRRAGITLPANAVPFQSVSDDGSVYELFNSAQTTDPVAADMVLSAPKMAI